MMHFNYVMCVYTYSTTWNHWTENEKYFEAHERPSLNSQKSSFLNQNR